MLQKSTLEFLTKLKENNDRDWFAANKKAFETEQNYWSAKQRISVFYCFRSFIGVI